MTVSILRTLAILPDGAFGVPLDTGELSAYLNEHCNRQEDRERVERHALRDTLYRDGGVDFMSDVVNELFTDPTVRELRRKWVPYTRFNNALKRIINELSTLYAAPAHRAVADSASNQRYQDLLTAVHMDEQALEINRLYNLHRSLLVGFRVAMRADGSRVPVIDIASPSVFRPVLHPNDAKEVVGWLIRVSYRSVRGADRPPAWALWTDHERALLDSEMRVIPGTWAEHGFGMCPWVPICRHPAQSGFWCGEEGEDLVAAQVSIWFSKILLMKETKSATRQTVIAGDTTAMARGQALESEVPLEAPDGVAINSVDMSMDLGQFRDVGEHVYDDVANNYGIAPGIRKHQGVQSAEARELMRVPIREQRNEQHPVFLSWEHRFVRVMAAVTGRELPEASFSPDGFTCDFGDAQTPMGPREKLELFKLRRELGLDNTVAYVMRENPDLTEEQAKAFVLANIDVELWRNTAMRPLMQISGAMGASAPGSAPSESAPAGAPPGGSEPAAPA